MLRQRSDPVQARSVATYQTRFTVIQGLYYLAILAAVFALGVMLIWREPDARVLAWLVYLCGAAAIVYQPRWGIYLIVFFALVGDAALMPWYPFVKNFSSRESIFFLSDALIVSPLETYILLTYAAWLGKELILRRVRIKKGPISWPAVIFLVFILAGLVWGLINGGNLNIALWEARPFFYLVGMILLGTNLLEEKQHFSWLLAWAVAAIFIESVFGTVYFYTVLGGSIAGIDRLTEHSASVHINAVFILFFGAWLLNGSPRKRWGLLLLLPVILIPYLASQRRAAFVSLAIAVLVLLIVLYFQRRQVFWVVFPIVSLLGAAYLGLFWNSTSAIALPAQAVKSVIAPQSTSGADYSSNLYRIIENINTKYTIQQRPLTGVGFGNPFYVLVTLPDISFFAWWNYFPHNSIIYIWVKAGVGAFLAMLVFIGTTIVTGAGYVARTKDPEARLLLLTGLAYVIVHFVYAYVDISWDAQSMIFLGAMVGMVNIAGQVLSRLEVSVKRRYPWQLSKAPEVIFLPLDSE